MVSARKCAVKVTCKWNSGDSFLHLVNASAGYVWLRMIFWLKINMTVTPLSPCSPDLTPCDFLLFPELNMVLKKMRFKDVTMIQVN
jgi:hypothetical protein